MNSYLLAAGILCILLGLVHSVLGEMQIFKHKRTSGIVPTKATPDLMERHLRIIWSSWHLVSVFGVLIGLFLIAIGYAKGGMHPDLRDAVLVTTAVAIGLGSVLVLLGTKGKHPGWAVLLIIAVLVLLGL